MNARASARVEVRGEVLVRIQGTALALCLVDLSRGGFAVRCDRPFRPGMTHRFTLEAAVDGTAVTLVAKAVHSRAARTSGPPQFVTGWEFMPARSSDDQAVIALLLAVRHGPPTT